MRACLASLLIAVAQAILAPGWLGLRAGPPGRIRFENVASRAGVDFVLNNAQTPNKHQIETMLGGVAFLDYDSDGWLDIYFVNGARIPELDKADRSYYNRLYRNQGDGTFRDVTLRAGVQGSGYGMGVAVGDYDNDGRPDIYVAGVNRNHLFRNHGDGTFSDVAESAGVSGYHPRLGKPFAIGAGWFDYDRDGDLDLLVIHYLKWSVATEPACFSFGIRAYCHPNRYEGLPNMLYRNNGDGSFTDVSATSGIGLHVGKGMGLAFADYDGDGFTDIFVSNDTFRNFLFRNKGDGTFAEVGVAAGVAYNEHGRAIAGMGADFRDIDNDGRPDIFQSAMIGDTFPLFAYNGRYFRDLTSPSGLSVLTSRLTAWGVGACDFDNDGRKDLFTANASILDNAREVENLPYELPASVFRNVGGRFADVSHTAGAGLLAPRAHRGAAFGDLDNDGLIDIVTTNLNAPPKILLNRSEGAGHSLLLELVGRRSNRDGLGASITAVVSGRKLHNHATTSYSYVSSNDRRIHLGLGESSMADFVEILWPSGVRQRLENVPAGKIIRVVEEEP